MSEEQCAAWAMTGAHAAYDSKEKMAPQPEQVVPAVLDERALGCCNDASAD